MLAHSTPKTSLNPVKAMGSRRWNLNSMSRQGGIQPTLWSNGHCFWKMQLRHSVETRETLISSCFLHKSEIKQRLSSWSDMAIEPNRLGSVRFGSVFSLSNRIELRLIRFESELNHWLSSIEPNWIKPIVFWFSSVRFEMVRSTYVTYKS